MLDLGDRAALLQQHPDVLFTTPHYDDALYVLARLDRTPHGLLTELIEDAWRIRAPARLLGETRR